MSDLENQVEDLEVGEEEQLDEFKASMGDPSEVPEPTATKATKRKADKTAGEKSPAMQGSSEKGKATEVPKTKMAMVNAMVQQMSSMSKADLASSYGNMMTAMMPKNTNEEVEEADDKIQLSADNIRITGADIDMQDDLDAMFGSDDLSEEFKEKASTIFEAAVVAKVNDQLSKITVDVESEINEAKEQIQSDLSEKMDSYLDYVVENWMDENKLAIEKGLKAEIAHDFMEGLKDLFAEHYIDVPDEKVDVAEELATKAEELEDSLNEQIDKNTEMKKALDGYRKADVMAEVASDLSDTQKEKFDQLAEGIDFTTEESYKKKIEMVKENYFPASVTEDATEVVTDEEPLELEEETAKPVDPAMAAYANAISRTKGSRIINNTN